MLKAETVMAAGRGNMSDVNSDFMILNNRLMSYINVSMDNTVDVSENIAEYCRGEYPSCDSLSTRANQMKVKKKCELHKFLFSTGENNSYFSVKSPCFAIRVRQ